MKSYIIFILCLVMTFSCSKFDVVNENPDVASYNDIANKPELLLTATQRSFVRRSVSNAWSEGNLMGQYGARVVFTSFDLFDWGDQSGSWKNYFINIRNAKEIEKIASENDLTGYQAVSKIMQAWMFSILTDMWGDIPYTEVNQAVADKNYTPSYDTQEQIYEALLQDLKVANELLANSISVIRGDLIFDNDLLLWRKFANSLRLRLALRLSEVKPQIAQSVIHEIYSNLSQYPIIESNEDNATVQFYLSQPDAHPVTEESVYRVGSYNEYRISEHFVNHLQKFNDPRLEFFADETADFQSSGEGNPIQGMQNGIVDGPAYEYKGGDAFLSKFKIDYFYFSPNSNDGRLMLASEVKFILAEAAQKGWIDADAEQFYNEGVQLNFDYWGVDMPADYLSNSAPYDGSLERIMDQKYIALFYTDYQGFIEYKRTGMPATIAPGPDAFYDDYPSRFEYPSSEESLNNVNYKNAVERLSNGDEITSKVWWEN